MNTSNTGAGSLDSAKRHGDANRLSTRQRIALASTSIPLPVGIYGVTVALPQMQRVFAAEPHVGLMLQIIAGVLSLTFAIACPLMGWLADRAGYRRVLLISLPMFGLFGAAEGLMPTLGGVLALRIVTAIALAGVITSALTGIGQLPEDDRARMMGLFSLIGGIFGMGMFPMLGLLAEIHWGLTFALCLVGVVLAIPVLMLPKQHIRPTSRGTTAKPWAGLGLGLPAIAALTGMLQIGAPMFTPTYLSFIGVTRPTLQALPLTFMGCSALVSSAAFGRVHRRLGTRGVFVVSLLFIGSGLLFASRSGSLPSYAIAMFIIGFGLPALISNVMITTAALSGRNAGKAIGFVQFLLYGAQSLFPFVAARVLLIAGPSAVLTAFGCLALLSMIAFLLKSPAVPLVGTP